jgi:hypothetical protein
MMAVSMFHDSKEEALPGNELYASLNESEGSDVYEDVDITYGVDSLVGKEKPQSQETNYG